MSRLVRIAACVLTALAAVGVSGCANDATFAGRVIDDTLIIAAPAITAPSPDLDAGFKPDPAASSAVAQTQQSQRNSVVAITGVGQYSRVASVPVSAGERVRAGDILATFDSRALKAELASAKADRAVAKAQVRVIDQALDDVDEGKADLANARATVLSQIDDAKKTRADLVEKRAQLSDVLDSLPPSLPATLPPGAPVPPNPSGIRAAIAQIDAGLDKIDQGLGKAQDGLGTIASARTKLADAKTQLDNARELAGIAASTARVGVDLAQWRLDSATLRAPESGTVISIVAAGDLLATDGTVATLRRDSSSRVSTWLTPEELERLETASASSSTTNRTRARVSADWTGGESFSAELVRIGTRAQYPPTSFATREVHMTRAIPVEFEVEGTVRLPAGAPVDVEIR